MRAGGTRVFPGAQSRRSKSSTRAAEARGVIKHAVWACPTQALSIKQESNRVAILATNSKMWFLLTGRPAGGRRGDWTLLAGFADDATYGWNASVPTGRDVRRHPTRSATLRWARNGLACRAPRTINGSSSTRNRRVVGFWKQVPPTPMALRSRVYGIGGSWFPVCQRRNGELAARFLRLRSCFRALPGVIKGRQAIARHAEAHRTRRVEGNKCRAITRSADTIATVVNR